MKKYIFALVLVLVPSFALASFDRSLSYGSNGVDVVQLQELLISQGCLSIQPTGYFGLLTLSGVKCFQSRYGISATGYFGELSRTKGNLIVSASTASSSAQQIIETGTVTPLQSICPLGYTCTPLTPVPVTSSCPIGYICNPIPSIQSQTSTSTPPIQPRLPGPECVGPTVSGYYMKGQIINGKCVVDGGAHA